MRDFEPFEANEFERRLLQAAEHDDPPPQLAARVTAAAGVGSGILTAASAAAGAGAGGAGVAKSLGVGFAVGLLFSVGAGEVFQSSTPSAPVASATAAAAAGPALPSGPARGAAAPVEGSSRPAEPALSALPSAVREGPGAPTRPAPSRGLSGPIGSSAARTAAISADATFSAPSAVASLPEESTLTEEVRALDEARRSLREGNPGRALALLDGRRRGPLAAEAAVVRVEALLRTGQRAAAEREAAPILASNPDGLHATRVRALLR